MHRLRYLVLVVVLAAGCVGHVHIAPVQVEPIHMTIDVNVHDDNSNHQEDDQVTSNRKP